MSMADYHDPYDAEVRKIEQAGNVVNLLELRGGQNNGVHRVHEKLQPGQGKPPFGTVSNALVILAHDPPVAGLLAFNEFTATPLIMRAPPPADEGGRLLPGPYPRPWGAEDVALLLAYVQRVWAAKMTKAALEDAMLAEASQRRFHPVRDWLATLKHDGKPRLDTWLTKAFGAPRDDYHRAVGAKFLIAAVRRVRQPGCKFDCLPVLEGDQGLGKSRACRELFTAAWFSDSMHPDFGSRDAPISLAGVWGMELGEIQQMIRNEVEVFKAFMSRPVDRYRQPYGKVAVDVPRQSVLIGTTNTTDYLRDTTGNRRVWPIRCTHADVDWIAANRDQLWAEAAAREASGEVLWLDDARAKSDAEAAQDDRMLDDPWTEKVFSHIGFVQRVNVNDILSNALNLALKDQDRKAQMRVADILRQQKWKKKRVREGGQNHWLWLHPDHEDYPK